MSNSNKKAFVAFSLLVAVMLVLVTINPSGMATATVLPKPQAAITLNAPVVNPDGTVTFTLNAPQANEVILNWQNMLGLSPAADPYPMTKDANGVWSITMGPDISPNNYDWVGPHWYGYAYIVDGVQVADPTNRDISFYQVPPLWVGRPSSVWSFVFVPGPATDYIADASVPHGVVSTVRYYSNLLQSEQTMLVYTPPGYNHDNRRYPVLYLYHGGGGLNTDWIVNMRANFIMDNMIAQGKVKPMILVMPEYNVRNCGSPGEDPFPQELQDSVIPATEQNFRVAPGAKNRALAGLSSGGGCVRNTIFQQPDAFAYIGLFSGGTLTDANINDLIQNRPDLINGVVNSKVNKLFWISFGGLEYLVSNNYARLAGTLAFFDQYHISYTYVDGPTFGAIYGHVWDTWSKDLYNFAPLLFH
jgi:enterochelin esterase-like enzyme